jgi:hypothetical protein
MTAFRKSQAIKLWCEKNVRWAPGGEAGELVGCISTAAVNGPTSGWTWKNLMENGLRSNRDGNWNGGGDYPSSTWISSTTMIFHSKHSKSFPPLRKRFMMTTRKNAKGNGMSPSKTLS